MRQNSEKTIENTRKPHFQRQKYKILRQFSRFCKSNRTSAITSGGNKNVNDGYSCCFIHDLTVCPLICLKDTLKVL